MEQKKDHGSESITNNDQTEVGLSTNGHKTKGNGSNNLEAVGSKDTSLTAYKPLADDHMDNNTDQSSNN